MKIFRLAGIDVSIHPSWFVIFGILLWSFSWGFFPLMYPGLTTMEYLGLGLVTSLLFFASVLLHELSHSVVAVRDGVEVHGITLFIFGGVTHMAHDVRTPGSELRIAAAGPLASFMLAAMFAGGASLWDDPWGSPWGGMTVHLSLLNLSLAVFNLLPGFPLDGGRLLRALLWASGGHRLRATMTASWWGRGLGWLLVAVGALLSIRGGSLQGIWLVLIGLYLDRMAAAEWRSARVGSRLAGLRVETVMTPQAVTIPAGTPAQDALADWFMRHGYSGFPVVRGDDVVGVISLPQVEACPATLRGITPVDRLMTPLEPRDMTSPEEDLLSAVTKMASHGLSRLPVLTRAGHGALIGLLTRHAIARRLRVAELAAGEGT
jgi:Zn-dependent protease/predicted transcriptional regulator